MNQYNRPKKNVKQNITPFSNYNGQFVCQRCKLDVTRARFWKDTFDFTWMCECRFVSKVNLYGKGY